MISSGVTEQLCRWWCHQVWLSSCEGDDVTRCDWAAVQVIMSSGVTEPRCRWCCHQVWLSSCAGDDVTRCDWAAVQVMLWWCHPAGQLPLLTSAVLLLLSACVRLQLVADRGRLCGFLSKTVGRGNSEVVRRLSKVGPAPPSLVTSLRSQRERGSVLTESSGFKASETTKTLSARSQPADCVKRHSVIRRTMFLI